MKLVGLIALLGLVLGADEFAGEYAPHHQTPRRTPGEEFDRPRSVIGYPPRTDLKSLRVATWNIDRGGDLRVIETELDEHPTDLLLLQEVDSGTARSREKDETANWRGGFA